MPVLLIGLPAQDIAWSIAFDFSDNLLIASSPLSPRISLCGGITKQILISLLPLAVDSRGWIAGSKILAYLARQEEP